MSAKSFRITFLSMLAPLPVATCALVACTHPETNLAPCLALVALSVGWSLACCVRVCVVCGTGRLLTEEN